jgi:hypothetical protein
VLHDWYTASAEELISALWLANPITVALLGPGYVPNRDLHKVWTDIAAAEIAGPGYAQKLLTGKAAPYNAGADQTDLQAADVIWGPGATFSAAYAAVYDTSGAKKLWSLVDFEETKNVANGVFVLDWLTAGALYLRPV